MIKIILNKDKMDYLKDKQYYIDRYDLLTIKECLDAIDICKKVYMDSAEDEKAKGFSKADRAKGSNWILNQQLFVIKAGRYNRKTETIQKWMDQDRIEQEKYDNTPEPQNVHCPDCKKPMSSKLEHLETLDNPLRMMFLFECLICKNKRWIYEDGTERKSTPQLCPKCKAEVKVSMESKDKVIWKTTCSYCGFSETTIDDFEKNRTEWKKQEEEDKKLLVAYREAFCSEEIGKEAFDYIEALKVANEVYEEELKKYDSHAYQNVIMLKKLSIIDLEKLLKELFEKEHFIKLSLGNPEIGQHVIVPFSVQDSDSSRRKETSVSCLQKVIKDALEGTNWRLMSDSLSYRLGYMSGRLKGYEQEEDFFELAGKKDEPKPKLKIDEEKRNNYAHHNVVQLAQLVGEHQGIENMRKRRLEKELEGFFLEASEGPYQCNICGENHYGNEIWWNLDGLRCIDCWRNIKEGIIPSLKHRYDNDYAYFENWQIQSDFGIRPLTAQKLRRQGILKGRDLKRKNGTIYCTVYLTDENKEFLEKYPRKPKQKMIITDILGERIQI